MTDVGRMRVASEVLGDLAIVEIRRGREGGPSEWEHKESPKIPAS
jgi:hypothetical protein